MMGRGEWVGGAGTRVERAGPMEPCAVSRGRCAPTC